MRPRLSYSNVVSSLCLLLLLGGGVAYAASHLGKNSVGSKQLKKNAVTGAKVKNQSLTGKDINLKKLGTVPSAGHASSADSANALSPMEGSHNVGAAGEPSFLGGSENAPATPPVQLVPVSFYKDHEGIVHLEGVVKVGAEGKVFTLPAGDRPAAGKLLVFEPGPKLIVFIAGGGLNSGPLIEGTVFASSEETVPLSGITFRAGS